VSACATCDGFFFRDKPIVVVGGGDTAMEEALFLTKFASKVDLIHRRDEFREQAIRFGTEIINTWIERVDLSQRPFTLFGKENEDADKVTTIVKADTLIIATGASAKWLGIPGEAPVPEGLGGNGVSACATCDGFFFRDKPIVVVGGGDTAMEEALFLTKFASKVDLVHRRDEFRASKIMQERVLAHEKINVQWNTEIKEIHGTKEAGVESVTLFNNQTKETTDFATQGVFVAIGHRPNTELFRGVLDMDAVGYLITEGKTMKTNIDGVFACGDAQDSYYRQAVTAAGTGCMAAIDAERFLAEHEIEAASVGGQSAI